MYACNLIINEHIVKRKLAERQVDNQANREKCWQMAEILQLFVCVSVYAVDESGMYDYVQHVRAVEVSLL